MIVGLGSHLYIELNCNFNHDHIHLFILFSYLLAILRNSPILYSINVEPNLWMLIQDWAERKNQIWKKKIAMFLLLSFFLSLFNVFQYHFDFLNIFQISKFAHKSELVIFFPVAKRIKICSIAPPPKTKRQKWPYRPRGWGERRRPKMFSKSIPNCHKCGPITKINPEVNYFYLFKISPKPKDLEPQVRLPWNHHVMSWHLHDKQLDSSEPSEIPQKWPRWKCLFPIFEKLS